MTGTPAPAATSSRAHAIDLLRLVAALQMITGHTIDALLSSEHRVGHVYATWSWIRGLTAVAFLFAAGISFAMVAPGRPDRRASRLRRAAMLLGIGYALHPPAAIFSADAAARDASLREFFAVDVLSCIGVSLLTLEALAARLRGRAFAAASIGLGLALLLVAPWTARLAPSGLALPVLDYVTRRGGSLFPLTPFAGLALLGAGVGTLARPREGGARTAATLAAFAASCFVAAWLAARLWAPPEAIEYHAWPVLSFERLGIVVVITLALVLATWRVQRLPRFVTDLGGETLFLYVSHLLVLYVGGVGLARWLGGRLDVGESVLAAVLMALACSAAGLAWSARKRARAARS